MKIGIVTYALYIGGVEIAIETLTKHFLKLGLSVDIIEVSKRGTQAQSFIEKGYSVKTILIKPFETRNNYAKRLAKEFNKYDILILNNVPFVHYMLGLLNSKTTILPILHNVSQESYNNLLINNKEWNKVICVSHTLEKSLIDKKEINPNKIVTIPTGVDVPSSFPKIDTKKDYFSLLYVGRIDDESKGVLLLPKIIKKVLQNQEEEIELKIVGDGPSKVALEKEIKNSNLSNYIKCLGSLPHAQATKEMQKADLLIMPSYHEGQGLVYLEAMAQGLIPLVSNLKDNTNLVIKDAKNGFLCPIGDIECFSDKIIYLLNHKEQIAQISKEAWITAQNELSSQVMAKRYTKLIEDLKNQQIKRSNKLEKIPFGNLPNFLYQIIHLFIRVKNKIIRIKDSI